MGVGEKERKKPAERQGAGHILRSEAERQEKCCRKGEDVEDCEKDTALREAE